jgi:hypothetical protein
MHQVPTTEIGTLFLDDYLGYSAKISMRGRVRGSASNVTATEQLICAEPHTPTHADILYFSEQP